MGSRNFRVFAATDYGSDRVAEVAESEAAWHGLLPSAAQAYTLESRNVQAVFRAAAFCERAIRPKTALSWPARMVAMRLQQLANVSVCYRCESAWMVLLSGVEPLTLYIQK